MYNVADTSVVISFLLDTGRDGEIKHEKLLKSRESRKQLTYNSDTVIRDINVGFLDILKHLDYSGNQRWEQLAGHLGIALLHVVLGSSIP